MDYGVIKSQAEAAIGQNGQAMVLRAETGASVDHTGVSSGGVTTDHAAVGIKRFYQESEIDGDLILRGDLQVILAASGGLPQPRPKHDQLIIGGETWDIEDCRPLAPGAETVLYRLQARK